MDLDVRCLQQFIFLHQMKPYLFLLLIITLPRIASDPTTAQLEVPNNFAFITVTHTRGIDYSVIQKHIQRYATLDCPIATDLNIVWNNDIEPSSAPFKLDKSTWKRPVNFLKTESNSMDWRYKIPSQSKSKVYFIIDDDVLLDCKELERGFKVWQENAIGNIGPIVTFAVRYYEYTHDNGFAYGRKKEKDMYSLGLVGLSFMSRHFMDLYYAKLELLEEMRKVVRQKNNCDDIGINWLVQYFYPELETIYVEPKKGNPLANSPVVAQSTSPTHYPYRSQCIQAFTKLFGVNALRYKPINDDYKKKEIRTKPMKEATVLTKYSYLQAIISGKAPNETTMKHYVKNDVKNDGKDEHLAIQEELKANISNSILLLQKKEDELDECKKSLRIIQNFNPDLTADGKVNHNSKIPLTEILAVSIIILILIISGLLYKIITLTHENRMLHIRNNQISAVDMHQNNSADENDQVAS